MSAIEIKLRPKFLEQAVEQCTSIRDPFFIWGPPGVGKSQIMKALAKRLGYEFIDIRMSQLEAIDLRGMPIIDTKGEEADVIWALPRFLPKDPKKKVLIFFDEMNHALASNLKASYQLIQERRLGEYKLPKNVVCGAAGNRKEDGGNDFDLPKPLQDRFTHLEIEVNTEDWLTWAFANNIHPLIIGFITAKPEYLQQYSEMSKTLTFATPRSWETISNHLYNLDLLSETTNTPDIITRSLIAGRVGNGIATEFMAYCELGAKLPNPIDILTGQIKTIKDKRVDILFNITSSLCIQLQKFEISKQEEDISQKEFNQLANNFIKFLGENCSKNKDLIIMAMKTAIKTYEIEFDAMEMPYFEKFLDDYGDLLTKYVAD